MTFTYINEDIGLELIASTDLGEATPVLSSLVPSNDAAHIDSDGVQIVQAAGDVSRQFYQLRATRNSADND